MMRKMDCKYFMSIAGFLLGLSAQADDALAPVSTITLPEHLVPAAPTDTAASAPLLPLAELPAASALEKALAKPVEDSKPLIKLGPPAPLWPDSAAEFDPLWDWVQVNTHEWFKGKIKSMEHGKIVFDSDKVGMLNLDWEDIRVLRSARPMAVFFNENSLAVGRLTSEGDNLLVHGSGGLSRIAMDSVVSMAAGSPEEIDYWSANIAVGMNIRAGNTDQTDFTASMDIQRRTARTNVKGNYRGNYASTNDVLDSNDHRASLSYDILFSRYWYARPVSVEYYRDPFQNVDSQWTYGFGVGYFIKDSAKLRWSVNAGPGYQMARFVEVEPGSSRKENTPAFILGTNYVQEVTPDVDFTATYQVTYTSADAGRLERNATANLDVDLTQRFDLTLGLVWDYVDEPQADALGVVPDQNDLRMTVGLKYEL